MKALLFVGALLLATAAQARPNSLNMTCAETKAMVQNAGAIVIGTGPHIYDRFVAHGGYCSGGEVTEPAWLETSDKDSCFIGYRCKQHDHN